MFSPQGEDAYQGQGDKTSFPDHYNYKPLKHSAGLGSAVGDLGYSDFRNYQS